MFTLDFDKLVSELAEAPPDAPPAPWVLFQEEREDGTVPCSWQEALARLHGQTWTLAEWDLLRAELIGQRYLGRTLAQAVFAALAPPDAIGLTTYDTFMRDYARNEARGQAPSLQILQRVCTLSARHATRAPRNGNGNVAFI